MHTYICLPTLLSCRHTICSVSLSLCTKPVRNVEALFEQTNSELTKGFFFFSVWANKHGLICPSSVWPSLKHHACLVPSHLLYSIQLWAAGRPHPLNFKRLTSVYNYKIDMELPTKGLVVETRQLILEIYSSISAS